MFHKEFRIKSQTLMKGSDKKKLRTDIIQQYAHVDDKVLTEIISVKDEMFTTKVETHSHDAVIIYSVQKTPVFFQIEKVIYPTVYLLWKFPDLILTFTTWPEVFKKLEGGAALMLPGVVLPAALSSDVLGEFSRDCCCAVRLRGNRAPVAVGKTVVSNKEMFESGMKGKGVNVLHTYQDFLWKCGDKSELPLLIDEVPRPVVTSESFGSGEMAFEDEFALTTDHLKNSLTVTENADSVLHPVTLMEADQGSIKAAEKENAKDVKPVTDSSDPVAVEENEGLSSPLEMPDDLLFKCFLYALKTNAKRMELPVLTSTFFRNCMVPCCPKGRSLDVKKSSYKKLSKFLAAMQERGFVKVEERTKGVESITDINRDHDELRSFRIPSWPLNDQDINSTEQPMPGSSYSPPVITDLLLVTADVLPFMKLYGKEKGSAVLSSEVKEFLTDYVKKNDLQEPTDKRMVRMDILLTQVLIHKNEYAEVLPFSDLLPRCEDKMKPAYRIQFAGKEPEIKKGLLLPIVIDISQRGANKKVTTIDNLDLYGIDLTEFASTVQKGVACSATIEKIHKDDKRVMVQGNQIKFIGQLLKDNYHLPLKYIKGLEKAPKKK